MIYEINPKNDIEHVLVYDMYTDSCNGFKVTKNNFLFIDAFKSVLVLEMQNDSHLLIETKKLEIKE